MVAIRNYRDSDPRITHKTAVLYSVFGPKGREGVTYDEAPLEGVGNITLHVMQRGKESDYHIHQDREQVFYFLKGRGKMKIDDRIYDIGEGTAVHIPPKSRHQLINDSDDVIENLVITTPVPEA